MTNLPFTTYADMIDHALDFLGGNASELALRDARRSILGAYRDFPALHNWSYLYAHGRITTSQPFGEGTWTYQQTPVLDTDYPRQLTITGSTWPSWAADGLLLWNDVVYQVDQRVSDTVLTLTEALNPGADFTADSTANGVLLVQSSYLLPVDLGSADMLFPPDCFGPLHFVHPRDWLGVVQAHRGIGRPAIYSIAGDVRYSGRLMISLAPLPQEVKTYDFVYKRLPRPLAVERTTTGTVTTDSATSEVVCTDPVFQASHVGSVLRVSADSSIPTGRVGDNPAFFERKIVAYLSPTRVTVSDLSPLTATGLGYALSDPIDMETGAMLTAFEKLVEYQLSMSRSTKEKAEVRAFYVEALERARAADSRSFAGRSPGDSKYILPRRLRDYPIDLNTMG